MDQEPEEKGKSPPPDGADGRNSLDDASKEAVREQEKRRDGGGHAGAGDIG